MNPEGTDSDFDMDHKHHQLQELQSPMSTRPPSGTDPAGDSDHSNSDSHGGNALLTAASKAMQLELVRSRQFLNILNVLLGALLQICTHSSDAGAYQNCRQPTRS